MFFFRGIPGVDWGSKYFYLHNLPALHGYMEVKYALRKQHGLYCSNTVHNRHSSLAFNNAWWLRLIRLKGQLPIRTSKKKVDASPFGPNSLSIGRKIRTFSMHMDDPKDPCKIKWYNPTLHGSSRFLDHLHFSLVKVFNLSFHFKRKLGKEKQMKF